VACYSARKTQILSELQKKTEAATDGRNAYHVHVEHVEQTLKKLFRRQNRSFVQLLLSQVVIVVHRLTSRDGKKTTQNHNKCSLCQSQFHCRHDISHSNRTFFPTQLTPTLTIALNPIPNLYGLIVTNVKDEHEKIRTN